ncbi:MAG: hypothetical protein HYW01_06410 [Deltaproteobacteria bacterium]|nr:hypothetical protein [Deltaproteobacteria bacterium]
MKHKKVETCRFCTKPISKGEFRDIHSDGNLVCLDCYNELNGTPENKKKYNAAYHYLVHGTPWAGHLKPGRHK